MAKCPKCGHQFRTKDEQFASAAQKARIEYPNAFKTWNPAEDAKLHQLVNDGASLLDLCTALGRQPSAIQKRMEMFAITHRVRPEPPVEEKTYVE